MQYVGVDMSAWDGNTKLQSVRKLRRIYMILVKSHLLQHPVHDNSVSKRNFANVRSVLLQIVEAITYSWMTKALKQGSSYNPRNLFDVVESFVRCCLHELDSEVLCRVSNDRGLVFELGPSTIFS